MKASFHISLPTRSIENTKEFYTRDLGFEVGRSSDGWLDLNLFDNQITFVLVDDFLFKYPDYTLDNEKLPSFHFGVVLDNDTWDKMYDTINKWSLDTIIKKTFFEDKNGEQNSFFVKDPNGYYIEFKTFKVHDEIFM